MNECIYTSTKVKNKMDRSAFNAASFPCHPTEVKLIWLNGSYPEIEALCKESGIETKPMSEMKSLKTISQKKGE